MLKCEICNFETTNLIAHLKSHNITGEEYRKKYNYNGKLFDANSNKIIDNVNADTLHQIKCYYVRHNNSLKNTAKLFNMSTSSLTRLLRKNNIVKPREYRYEVMKTNSIKKYGVSSVNMTEEKKTKTKTTLLEKYGVSSVFQINEVKEKIKKNNLEKYGVEYFLASSQCRAALKNKYGKRGFVSMHIPEKYIDIISNKEKFHSWCIETNAKLSRKPKVGELSKEANVTKSLIYSKIREYDCRDLIDYTIPELEIYVKDWLDSLNIKYIMHDRKIIHPKELDFYLPECNIAIEVNDTYSHNSTRTSFGDNNITPTKYHQNKVIECMSKGVHLIHLYEWEILDEHKFNKIKTYILSLIGKVDKKIYARKCKIKEVYKSEARQFYRENHLQGPINSLNINYGLYYDNVLVSCMSFGKPRFNKKYEYELLRFANKAGYSVVGAASKLFNAFTEEYNPNNIISYCDMDKFSGRVYEFLGFNEIDCASPTFTWTDYERIFNWKVILDKGPDKILGTDYGKGANNEEIMLKEGFVKVYNSGNKVYVWNND